MSVTVRDRQKNGVVSTLSIFSSELDVIDAASVDAAAMRNELAERNTAMQGMEAELEALRFFVPAHQQLIANEARLERQQKIAKQQSIDTLNAKLVAVRVQLAAMHSRETDILADLKALE